MARSKSKKKSRRNRKFTLSLAVLGGIAPTVGRFVGTAKRYDINTAFDEATRGMTGYSYIMNKFDYNNLKMGLLPLASGVIVHAIASKVGFNRMLAAAKVPFVRI